MKTKLILPLLLLWAVFSFAQILQYSRLEIPSTEENYRLVSSLGIDLIYTDSDHFIVEIDDYEKRLLDNAGIVYRMTIENLEEFYSKRNEGVNTQQALNQYRQDTNYAIPDNFTLGSMGGFCTYAEILQHMDTMFALFPDLISEKDTLPGLTIEGRPVYWQRISNNPQVKQNKPEVFYNALVHAREPASMQQMLFYMYYLLENYATSDDVKNLVDNLEMYFVPCANPDGYLYVQTINPEGGGMWRKNRRLNYNGSYGVDLNRNFGFMWGYDNFGSSPNPSSITYRGEAPFSEPETQMIRDFTLDYDFKVVLNFHSYGNLLLHSYGYASVVAPDYPYIRKAATLLTEQNGYTFGTAQRLLYLVNGDATDWFYGEEMQKPRMFAFTPEVGTTSDGFWPEIDRIIELCHDNVHLNIMAARLAGSYAELFDCSDVNITEKQGFLEFGVSRIGLSDEPVEFLIQPLTDNILSMQIIDVVDSLPLMEMVFDSIAYELASGTFPGERVEFVVTLHNKYFTKSDTVRKIFGPAQQIFYDSCNNLDSWNAFSWHLSTKNAFTPPSSILNHDGNFYPNNGNGFVYSNSHITLTEQNDLWVSFYADWDLDGGRDFVTFVVSDDNGATWQPYGGKYTSNTFLNGEVIPLFQGESNGWVNEKILVNDIAGKKVRFGFKFQSDNRIGRTGFFFDDFEVLTIDTETQHHEIVVSPGWSGISSFLAPVENNVQQLFGDNLNHLIFFTDKSDFFQPYNPDNTLLKWDSENGYLIKANEEFTLIINGYPEKSIHLELEKGYRILPVLTVSAVIVEEIETIPPGAIEFINDACGLGVYWPQYGIKTLEYLQPGKSYFIQLSEDATLIMN